MKQDEDPVQTLKNDFSLLTEENRKSVIEMTRFLVITQNSIVPEFLNFYKTKLNTENRIS